MKADACNLCSTQRQAGVGGSSAEARRLTARAQAQGIAREVQPCRGNVLAADMYRHGHHRMVGQSGGDGRVPGMADDSLRRVVGDQEQVERQVDPVGGAECCGGSGERQRDTSLDRACSGQAQQQHEQQASFGHDSLVSAS
jgi:hypothetical protein